MPHAAQTETDCYSAGIPSLTLRDKLFGRNAHTFVVSEVRNRAQQTVEILDRLRQSLFELDFGLPSEQLVRLADVGLPLLGIVRWERSMNDLRRGSGQGDRFLS